MSKLNSKNLDDSKFTTKKIIIILTLTAFASFIVRLFYFPFDLPLTNDAAGYFWYANDMAILGNFPSDFASRTGQEFPNNGWPAFLSVFFSSMNSNEFLDFVNPTFHWSNYFYVNNNSIVSFNIKIFKKTSCNSRVSSICFFS